MSRNSIRYKQPIGCRSATLLWSAETARRLVTTAALLIDCFLSLIRIFSLQQVRSWHPWWMLGLWLDRNKSWTLRRNQPVGLCGGLKAGGLVDRSLVEPVVVVVEAKEDKDRFKTSSELVLQMAFSEGECECVWPPLLIISVPTWPFRLVDASETGLLLPVLLMFGLLSLPTRLLFRCRRAKRSCCNCWA